MRKYNIRGYNVNLGFDKKYKILYIKPNESNKVITLYINTGNMLLVDALDIEFNISSNNPNIMQPRKLQYLLSAAGINKRDIINIISAYNNPMINNKFNTYKMSKCIMHYRMRMLEIYLKFAERHKFSLLSKDTMLLMGFTRCEKYIYTHLGMMHGICCFRFTTNELNELQAYVLGKTSVFIFDGNSFVKEEAKVLIPIEFNHEVINNNHIIILDRTYTTNTGYILPVTVLKISDTLTVEFDASDKEDIKNDVDKLYDIKYKNDIFII